MASCVRPAQGGLTRVFLGELIAVVVEPSDKDKLNIYPTAKIWFSSFIPRYQVSPACVISGFTAPVIGEQ